MQERFVKTFREETTFHNNYTNTLGLELGIERRWKLADQISLYAGLGFAPTYVLSSSGKITDFTTVEELIYDNEVGKFSLNGGINAGVIYSINPSINLELNYQFNQLLSGELFIHDGMKTKQQSVFSLGISYRL